MKEEEGNKDRRSKVKDFGIKTNNKPQTLDLQLMCKPVRIIVKDCCKQNDVVKGNVTSEIYKCKPVKIILEDCLKQNAKGNVELNTVNHYQEKLKSCLPYPFYLVFSELEKSVLSEDKLKHYSKVILEKLTDNNNVSKPAGIIFIVLKYISLTTKNPLRFFKETRDPRLFLLPIEKLFVSVLCQINSNMKLDKEGFLDSVTVNIRQLLLGMNSLTKEGCCALCRVFTQVCKAKDSKTEVLTLCCDLLKTVHKFSPLIIACIVGVWPELFEVPWNADDEEVIFHSALALGAQKSLKISSEIKSMLQMSTSELEVSSFALEVFMSASPKEPTEGIINVLMDAIIKKSAEGSSSGSYFLTSSIVIFAAHKGCEWTKENIVLSHLIPQIKFFSETEPKKEALSVFCNLYAEVCFLYPEICSSENILLNLFDNEIYENEFVQDSVAPALIKFLLLRNHLLPESLRKWYESSDSKFESLKLVFHRASLSKKTDFSPHDIVCP